jgi:hypothetical protein
MGKIDSWGVAARFSHIDACLFDAAGRLVVRESGNGLRAIGVDDGLVQEIETVELVGVQRVSVGAQKFMHVWKCPEPWPQTRLTALFKHVHDRDKMCALVFEDTYTYLFVATMSRAFVLGPNNLHTVLFDADRTAPLCAATAPQPSAKTPRQKTNLSLPTFSSHPRL